MAILSIQSHVTYGYVGNTAATFPLQRLGYDVWAVNTVEFSNHTGYRSWRGIVLNPDLVGELILGLEEREVLHNCEAVLSGYMGDPEVGHAIIETVKKIRNIVPGLLYCCDPVMGDVGRGFYVRPGIPEIFKNEVIPLADIVTPNQFELEALTGISADTIDKTRKAIDAVHAMGPRIVLVTSYRGSDTPEGHLSMLVSDGSGLYRITTRELILDENTAGSGDLTTALFLARYLETRHAGHALEKAAASIFGIMEATSRAKSKELYIVKAQDEIVSPGRSFTAEKL
ncbi:pyridoxal kinase PdxY [Breznakiella homolactica]|uniref:pyridoxal kinase n=1 Tax=Breznakiella homolactica TaxID=2798577 RepID=A0A7T7XLT7_9SPIR|nr:pyridoxal kinase PdxY [Breznakiella homolactica]QQO08587.1 pyridoxal kinase PdxY [Breznakiella homolactica]